MYVCLCIRVCARASMSVDVDACRCVFRTACINIYASLYNPIHVYRGIRRYIILISRDLVYKNLIFPLTKLMYITDDSMFIYFYDVYIYLTKICYLL